MWNQIAVRTRNLVDAVRFFLLKKSPTLPNYLPVLPYMCLHAMLQAIDARSCPSSPQNSLVSHSHEPRAPTHPHTLAVHTSPPSTSLQGSNLSRNAVVVVAATSTVSAILFIVLAILGQSFLLSAAGAALFVIVIIVYLVGASKLAKAIGDRNPAGLRVVKLTRQVAAAIVCNILVQLSWVVVGGRQGPAILPLKMVITNLLMPITMSATMLLLLRFIGSSFKRIGTGSFFARRSARKLASKRESRSPVSATRSAVTHWNTQESRSPQSTTRSTKASATVAPATDFTATSATSGATASH